MFGASLMTLEPSPAGPLSRVRERVRVRARELRKASPDAERKRWYHLRDRRLAGFKFRRQHPIGRYFADFACLEAMLVVELDGGQHYSDAGEKADIARSAIIEAKGYQVLRFSNHDVMKNRVGLKIHEFSNK